MVATNHVLSNSSMTRDTYRGLCGGGSGFKKVRVIIIQPPHQQKKETREMFAVTFRGGFFNLFYIVQKTHTFHSHRGGELKILTLHPCWQKIFFMRHLGVQQKIYVCLFWTLVYDIRSSNIFFYISLFSVWDIF